MELELYYPLARLGRSNRIVVEFLGTIVACWNSGEVARVCRSYETADRGRARGVQCNLKSLNQPTGSTRNNHQLVEADMCKLRYVELFKLVAQLGLSKPCYLPNAKKESADITLHFSVQIQARNWDMSQSNLRAKMMLWMC